MISVVIPTLNAETTLGETLGALVPAVVDGLVKEVIVVDGGSTDDTAKIVDIAGAALLRSASGRGTQLAAGAKAARFQWLLFLHADTVLTPGWERDAATFMERVDSGRRPTGGAAFRFALDDSGVMPRLLEKLVSLRCALFGLPYGDQGLLIRRRCIGRSAGTRMFLLWRTWRSSVVWAGGGSPCCAPKP